MAATTYTVIKRAMITEKALAAKETEGTLVFEVASLPAIVPTGRRPM